MEIEDRVRTFILEEIQWPGKADRLTPTFQLMENNVLDSMGIFKLVSFLETEYDIEIEDEELVPDNFQTMESVSALVRSKL